MNKNSLNYKSKYINLSKIFIIIACLIPFIFIIIMYLFYNIPKKYTPYIIDLSGSWKIHEGNEQEWINPDFNDDNWRKIKLPGNYYKQGFSNKHSLMRKKFILKKKMINEDLFFMIGGIIGSMGNVYINGIKIGEIGLIINERKIYSNNSKYGFIIKKSYLNSEKLKENIIVLEFSHETIGYNRILDPRIFIGTSSYLKPYFLKNVFITSFFQYGQIYSSLFILLILLILLVTEWGSEDRYKYISTSLLVLSVFFYNLFFSGIYLLYLIRFEFLIKLQKVSVIFICIACLEFIQYYFYKKTNIISKINRIICFAVIFLFFLFNNFVFLQIIYTYFIYYFFIIILYMCTISFIGTFFLKTKKYGIIITTSIILVSITGIIDLLTTLDIIHIPLFFNITISIFIMMSATIIITEFISISYINKQLTYELKELNETLEIKVDERTKELLELNNKLKRLNNFKNEFIANITHDFRSPLMAILNLADLALKDEDQNAKENCSLIYDVSIKLKDYVDRLLELAKLDTHRIKLKIKKIEPVKYLVKIIDFYSTSFIGNKIKIIKNLPDKEINDFYSDPERLEEVLSNIFSNAIKFADNDSGIIIVEMIEKKDSILISIKDNGVGIPKNKLKVIFKRFEQVNGIFSKGYKGTGIGLAFAKQLMDYLKGKIWAESEGKGQGSTFHIELKKGLHFQ